MRLIANPRLAHPSLHLQKDNLSSQNKLCFWDYVYNWTTDVNLCSLRIEDRGQSLLHHQTSQNQSSSALTWVQQQTTLTMLTEASLHCVKQHDYDISLLTWVILKWKQPCSWKGHHPIMCSLTVRGCAVWGSQHVSINSPDARPPSYTEVIYTGEDWSSKRPTLFSDISFHFLTETSEPLYDPTQMVLIQENSEQWLPAGSCGEGHPEVKGLESTTFHHWPLVVG